MILPRNYLRLQYDCYARTMKAFISIPDSLFRKAEALAMSRGISRSELYTNALANFVAQDDEARVTERLNEVYASQGSTLDPVIETMQLLSLGGEQW